MPNPLFLLATPIFGLALHLDPTTVALPSPVLAQIEAQLDSASDSDSGTASASASASDSDSGTVSVSASGTDSASASASASDSGTESVADQLARRRRIGRVHRAMGITTWGAMTVAVITGTFQYYNLYGFFADQGSTPCVRGTQIGSAANCTGAPIIHATSAGLTAAAYITTFSLSFAMPDPIGLDRGDSQSARRLRRHKRLRWAHLSGMIAQTLLGIVIANDRAFGLDRANHFRELQALSTVHMVTGYATYGLLTWAGATMMRR